MLAIASEHDLSLMSSLCYFVVLVLTHAVYSLCQLFINPHTLFTYIIIYKFCCLKLQFRMK
jgi:hypothetical protein